MRLINPYGDLFAALEGQTDAFKLGLRKKLIWAYSWAIPSQEALDAIASYSPILEVGAGSGYWAWLLGQAGARVTAVDQEPGQPPHWVKIESGGPADAGRAPSHALLLCWPPLDSPMASDALKAYQGDTVLYIGEWRGRTADAAFHDQLDHRWKLERKVTLPHWPGFEDDLYVLSRLLGSID